MTKKNLGSQARTGILWSGTSTVILLVTRLGTSMVLARLLFPEDFGLMGIAILVTQFAKYLTNFGFNLALVQRKDLKAEHMDTVFVVNFFLTFGVTASIYVGAEQIGVFFNNSTLPPILQVISFLFIIRGLGSVNQALLTRRMKFKELAFTEVLGTLITFVSPIFFALAGYGVWSLVWGQLLGSLVTIVLVFIYCPWYPTLRFRFQALKDVFSFGFWVFIIRCLTYFIEKLDYLFIGKFLGVAPLGFYERAYALTDTPRGLMHTTTNRVLFSAFSQIQDDNERIANVLKKGIASVAVLTYGAFIWLYFAAPSLVTVLYGPKWTSSIVPVQIMCFSGAIHTMTLLFFPVINAKDLLAKRAACQFAYLVILAGALWFGLRAGINGVAWAVTISSSGFLMLVLLLVSAHLPFSPKDFLVTQKPAVVYGCVQIAVLLALRYATGDKVASDSILMLILVSALSLLSYLSVYRFIKFEQVQESFDDMFKEAKTFMSKFRKKKSSIT